MIFSQDSTLWLHKALHRVVMKKKLVISDEQTLEMYRGRGNLRERKWECEES